MGHITFTLLNSFSILFFFCTRIQSFEMVQTKAGKRWKCRKRSLTSHPFSFSLCESVCMKYRKEKRPRGARLQSASAGSRSLWVYMSVSVCVCFRPMGQCLRNGECAAHSCFSAHFRGRSEGWEDSLLPAPPNTHSYHPSSLCHRGTVQMERKGVRQKRAHQCLTHPPQLWTSLTVPASSLQAYFSFQIQRVSLSISAISFLSEWQRSLRFAEFVYFHERVSDSDLLWWSNRVVMKRGG